MIDCMAFLSQFDEPSERELGLPQEHAGVSEARGEHGRPLPAALNSFECCHVVHGLLC